MGAVDFIIAGIPIFLSIAVPGCLFSFALLNRTRLSFAEKFWFGVALGLIIPPLFGFIANLAGVPFSLALALASVSLATLVGAALCIWQNVEVPKLESLRIEKHWPDLVLSAIILLAFYIRIQSLSPVFYEFDPYWYMMQAQFLLTKGFVPGIDDLGFYPLPDTHRTFPLVSFLEAFWYSFYTQGGAYDNLLLSLVANVYPPLVGALLCFAVFQLLKTEYGKEIGLVAAGLVAFTPRLIDKTLAGEAEFQPWGLFAAGLFWASYAMTMKEGSRRYAVLAALALIGVTLGSSGTILAYLVMAGYICLQSVVDFLGRGRANWRFVELNAIVLSGSASSILLSVYWSPFGLYIPRDPLVVLAALAFAAGLTWLSAATADRPREEVVNYFVGGAFALLVLLALTPLGEFLFSYVKSAAAIAKPSSPLMQTVAEENPTGSDLAAALGYLGREYPVLGWISYGISALALGTLRVLSDIFDIPPLPTQPNGSLMWMVLAMTLLTSIHAMTKGSRLAALWLVLVFPITYVGLGKVKHVLQLSLVVIIGFAAALGEAARIAVEWSKANENALRAAVGLGAAFVLLNLSLIWGVLPASATYLGINPNNAAEVNAFCSSLAEGGNHFAAQVYCTRIPDYWLNAMEWLKRNVGEDERVLHWWDYGHWTNFFAGKKVITRNDHKYPEQDLEVANAMVAEEPEHLADWMRAHKAKYFLVDIDLINKWGALVYLSCIYNNQTRYEIGPGGSECDAAYQWERVYVPRQPSISEFCAAEGKQLVRAFSSFGLTYCIEVAQTPSGPVPIMYYENGTLNRGFMSGAGVVNIKGRPFSSFIVWYPERWLDGQSGLPDRKGKGYDSAYYKAFFLGNLSGFTQVYPDYNVPGPSIPVRIFKLTS
ncbi:MAG: STT3 domain-containing protein [Candidatus Micrarchaeia archaeon]